MIKSITLKSLIFLCLILFDISFSNATGMIYGDAVTGTIDSPEELHTYSFAGTAGDVILIRMRGVSNGGVDACLQLLDPSNTIVMEDCDDGGLVKIEQYTLLSTGIYTIQASDHNNNDTGIYGLSIERINGATYPTYLECGTDLTASLDHLAEMKSYSFEAAQGDRIRVHMRSASGGLESELTIYDQAGEKVVEGVRASGLNTIEDFVLPSSGIFTLIAQDGNGNDTGSFGLSIENISNPNCGKNLTCGDRQVELENMAEMEAFSMKASAGDHVILDVFDSSASIEPIIRMYDENGTLLETVKAESDVHNIQLEIASVPADGTYKILISDLKGNDTGLLNLQVQFVGASCGENISCENQSMTSELEYAGDIKVYDVPCVAGDILNIQMRAVRTTIEPALTLYNPDGSVLATTSSNGSLARLDQIEITQDGTYSIEVADDGGNDFGSYGFSIQNVASATCPTRLECDYEFINGQLDHYAEMDAYVFKAEEGQVLTVVMDEVDVAIEPKIELYAPDGTYLGGQEKSYHADITNYTLPMEGEYILLASDKNGNDKGAYAINFNLAHYTGQSICVTCDDGVQNGDEEGIDCGGAFCGPCCAPVGTACTVCPDDLVLTCSELANSTPNVAIDAEHPIVKQWLDSAMGLMDCGVVVIENGFDASIFETACGQGGEVSQTVEFKGVDPCGNVSSCAAMITVIDDVTPTCPDAGTACDDGNDATINDVEDGQCNCIGEPVAAGCEAIDFNNYTTESYGDGQDFGAAVVKDNGAELRVRNNAWKSIPFDYEITSETILEFEFRSTKEGEIHGIGFDNDASHNDFLVFNLYGTQSWGQNAYTNYPGDGEWKQYTINVGDYYTGIADRITFLADHDASPRNGNSFFRNVKVYEKGSCGDTPVACGTGTISRDVWTGIQGYPLSTVPWNTMPMISDEIDVFEIPVDVMDYYGTRLRGYICPPQTGSYTFWISSDDFGELWLSTDDNRDNVNMIAEVPGWTHPRVWNKYPEQKSVEIYLEAGRRYYVEAYMKEHRGLDNLAVGWQLPDGTQELPMSGMHLSPWDGPMINRVNPTINLDEIDSTAGLRDGEEVEVPARNIDYVGFEVFPNPANEVLNVVVPEFVGKDVSIELFNNLGQVMLTQQWNSIGSPNLLIDLKEARVERGYYNLVVRSGEKMLTQSVIVME